ncbi:MAG: hypothetical protein NXI24_00265 [bacterium]|nr:hypothetical protein [bacterium]
MSDAVPNNQEAAESSGGQQEYDPRKLLAIHPREADRIFNSQGSYGSNDLTADFREQVKALSQVYQAIQRYLTGVFRRDDIFYPEIEDVAKDLVIYKRSISDKIPMPTDEQLRKYCICLAAQTPPLIHILREVAPDGKSGLQFVNRYVAPTDKHEDKVLVGYKSTIQSSLRTLKSVIEKAEFGHDYGTLFHGTTSIADLPLHMGRADQALRGMYIDEKGFQSISSTDLAHVRKVNQELYKRLYRPLLMQAVRDRLFVSISCDDVRKTGFAGAEKVYDIVLFAKTGEIQNRFASICAYLKPQYLGEWLSAEVYNSLARKRKAGEISESEFFSSVAQNAYEKLITQNEPPLKELLLVVEIMKLSEWYRKFEKQQAKDSAQSELKDVIAKIKAFGGVYRTRNNRSITISEDLQRMMLRGKIPGILACTEPYMRPDEITNETDLELFDNIHIIYRDRSITAKAVETATELFEKSDDVYLLRVLESLYGIFRESDTHIKQYLAPVYIEKLRHTIRRSYARHLPWWSRLLLFLTSSEMTDARLARIRQNLQSDQERRLSRMRIPSETNQKTEAKKARDEVRKLARQRAGEGDAVQKLGSQENKVFESIRADLDAAWNRGAIPVRGEVEKMARGAEREDVQKILGMVDVGAASVREILRIPISGYEHVYANREYLMQNRDTLIERYQARVENESVIIHDNREMLLKGQGDGKDEVYKGMLDYLRYRLK